MGTSRERGGIMRKYKEKIKVCNTPTLKDAENQLEYMKIVHHEQPSKATIINLNRAWIVYNTKLINGEK